MTIRETPKKKYYTVDEASAYSSLSAWTLRRLCYSGTLASTKIGARLLIPVESLHDLLDENTSPPGPSQTPDEQQAPASATGHLNL